MKVKIIKIDEDNIYFDNGYYLQHYHENECCENHYLDFSNLEVEFFDGLLFDITSPESLFERVPDFGIRLKPINDYPIAIPGYAENNGYYSDNLSLILYDNKGEIVWESDITECQNW